MVETSLVAFALSACGALTLAVLLRALLDVLSEQAGQSVVAEVHGRGLPPRSLSQPNQPPEAFGH